MVSGFVYGGFVGRCLGAGGRGRGEKTGGGDWGGGGDVGESVFVLGGAGKKINGFWSRGRSLPQLIPAKEGRTIGRRWNWGNADVGGGRGQSWGFWGGDGLWVGLGSGVCRGWLGAKGKD